MATRSPSISGDREIWQASRDVGMRWSLLSRRSSSSSLISCIAPAKSGAM